MICFIFQAILVESQQQRTNMFNVTRFQGTLRPDEIVVLSKTMSILSRKRTMDILFALLVLTLDKYFPIMVSAKKTVLKINNEKRKKENILDKKTN